MQCIVHFRKFDPGAKVLCVEGDSAFGFSGMEFETMARFNYSCKVVSVSFLLYLLLLFNKMPTSAFLEYEVFFCYKLNL